MLAPVARPEPARSRNTGCIHCGLPVAFGRNSSFCCAGCEAVYGLLEANQLGHYYELKKRYADPEKCLPSLENTESYSYLDDPEVRMSYADSSGKEMNFYLEGVHCVACVWITERIPTLLSGVKSVHLDLSKSRASVEITEGGSFADVALEFERLGYRPHPEERKQGELRDKREKKFELFRIAVAAAGAGNIMLLSIATYSGAGPEFSSSFRWINAFLFLPVLTFSAAPFFYSAYSSLRRRVISIDVPIAFGIGVGSIASFVSLISGGAQTYFDSLASLIFLLLASRYFLRTVQNRAVEATHLFKFLTPSRANRRLEDGTVEECKTETLRPGEIVVVRPGEVIPVDGEIIAGSSDVSRSWLTGESRSEEVRPGHAVSAGSLNETRLITVRVERVGAQTRLGDILKQTQVAARGRSKSLYIADQMARYFVPFTFFFIAVGVLIGLQYGVEDAVLRGLAVAIVACPCAFALAIPLAMSRTIGKLAQHGTLVRGPEVIERLSLVDTVFFDKTGTLTYGDLRVLEWTSVRKGLERVLLGLEINSIHPVARAIRKKFSSPDFIPAEISELREVLGRGVEGEFEGKRYTLTSMKGSGSDTEVELREDGKTVGMLVLGDEVRPGAKATVGELKRLGFRVGLLSGDRSSAVYSLSDRLGISRENVRGECTPEDKVSFLKKYPRALMVGDGVNDAIALASTWASIAVNGGLEASMQAAGVYTTSRTPLEVIRTVRAARETMKVVRRNLAFTILYNVVVIGVALSGDLSPLFAAVAMPVSATVVFLISLIGTGPLRRALSEVRE
jgi:heavy metal translocating P-type ATPase